MIALKKLAFVDGKHKTSDLVSPEGCLVKSGNKLVKEICEQIPS